MTVKPLTGRDHRIDLFRGFALLSIFVNHVPGNLLEPFTAKNFGLSDSAELFVLLAGIAAAFAYFPRFVDGHPLVATGRAVKRAGLLYVAHLASTSVGIGIFCAGVVLFDNPALLDEINLASLRDDPIHTLIGIPLLTHQLGYHNILPMYVCLLLALPLIMVLARVRLWLVPVTAVAVYALAHVFTLSLPNYPTTGTWFFNPLTWQLIFAGGFFAGVRILNGLSPLPYRRWAWWLGVGYLVWACVHHRWNLYGTIPEIPFLPHNFQINEKPWVAFPRLMHILALAYVVGHSPIGRWLTWFGPMMPLTLMGRHALPVFWLGTALSMVGQVLMLSAPRTPVEQVLGLALGLALQIGLAYGLDRLATAEKASRRPGSKPPRPVETALPTPIRAVA